MAGSALATNNAAMVAVCVGYVLAMTMLAYDARLTRHHGTSGACEHVAHPQDIKRLAVAWVMCSSIVYVALVSFASSSSRS